MNYILFDDFNRDKLLPLTFTRPVGEIRTGILRIREKWEIILESELSYFTEHYLSQLFPLITGDDNICILGGLLPDSSVVEIIRHLQKGEFLLKENRLIAFRAERDLTLSVLKNRNYHGKGIKHCNEARIIDFPWHIFSLNGDQISFDYELVTRGRKSESLSSTNQLLGNQIFIEAGARVECSVINSLTGPVYIGKNSEIMEGSLIRGPFSLGEESVIKMGAKIYGPTTIGPHSKAGGEINNSVIFAYSNKGHDGFLGNSVIGEWCNLGADSNNSNLKNNYAEVRIWDYTEEKFIPTGLQFCGLIMADHSKCGINTMFNTGTVVGVNANIFGSGFPRNFIPDFSWGGAHGFSVFNLDKAFEVAEKVMQRRGIEFGRKEKDVLTRVFTLTEKYRK